MGFWKSKLFIACHNCRIQSGWVIHQRKNGWCIYQPFWAVSSIFRIQQNKSGSRLLGKVCRMTIWPPSVIRNKVEIIAMRNVISINPLSITNQSLLMQESQLLLQIISQNILIFDFKSRFVKTWHSKRMYLQK